MVDPFNQTSKVTCAHQNSMVGDFHEWPRERFSIFIEVSTNQQNSVTEFFR